MILRSQNFKLVIHFKLITAVFRAIITIIKALEQHFIIIFYFLSSIFILLIKKSNLNFFIQLKMFDFVVAFACSRTQDFIQIKNLI